jgi:antitoxin component YwqK of YwqJK toxin-antitoxin module
MKKSLLLLCLAILPFLSLGQEKILYVVDLVPILNDPEPGDEITEADISESRILDDRNEIAKLGYKNADAIYYITTKKYAARPDSLKAIPTMRTMDKINGQWFLKNKKESYSGRFIDYYLNGAMQGKGVLKDGRLTGLRTMYHSNGQVSDEVYYANGLPQGTEKRYYENGVMMQSGSYANDKETGVWELYHPNGALKQRANFENGLVTGKSETYYSTGKLKSEEYYKDGEPVANKDTKKFTDLYNEGVAADRVGDFKTSIKKYSKCIDLIPGHADAWFARGTARLNAMEFEEAIKDLDKALEIEPIYMQAYGNRAFARIKKHEITGSKEVPGVSGVTIVRSKKDVVIPQPDLSLICADLAKSVELGDTTKMTLEAVKKYCK